MKKNKESLKKDARELNMKVNFWVNGSSCDVPKELIVFCELERQIFAILPVLAVETAEEEP